MTKRGWGRGRGSFWKEHRGSEKDKRDLPFLARPPSRLFLPLRTPVPAMDTFLNPKPARPSIPPGDDEIFVRVFLLLLPLPLPPASAPRNTARWRERVAEFRVWVVSGTLYCGSSILPRIEIDVSELDYNRTPFCDNRSLFWGIFSSLPGARG